MVCLTEASCVLYVCCLYVCFVVCVDTIAVRQLQLYEASYKVAPRVKILQLLTVYVCVIATVCPIVCHCHCMSYCVSLPLYVLLCVIATVCPIVCHCHCMSYCVSLPLYVLLCVIVMLCNIQYVFLMTCPVVMVDSICLGMVKVLGERNHKPETILYYLIWTIYAST